jgi:hypothetical protein
MLAGKGPTSDGQSTFKRSADGLFRRYLGGEGCRAVALRFGVSVSSVVKWSRRYRATGSVRPGHPANMHLRGASERSKTVRGLVVTRGCSRPSGVNCLVGGSNPPGPTTREKYHCFD